MATSARIFYSLSCVKFRSITSFFSFDWVGFSWTLPLLKASHVLLDDTFEDAISINVMPVNAFVRANMEMSELHTLGINSVPKVSYVLTSSPPM